MLEINLKNSKCVDGLHNLRALEEWRAKIVERGFCVDALEMGMEWMVEGWESGKRGATESRR